MQLTEHFALEEFTRSAQAAALGIANVPTAEHLAHLKVTAAGLEWIRTELGGKALHLSSGYRCPPLNKAVGGVPDSDHALGWAADFECPTFGTPYQIAMRLAVHKERFDQLIHERKPGSWWVHVSFNPRMRHQLLTLLPGGHYGAGIFMPAQFAG